MKNLSEFLNEMANVTGTAVQSSAMFMKKRVFKVSQDDYLRCVQGKRPNGRWDKQIHDETTRTEIKKYARNSKGSIIIQDSDTHVMSFLRR